MAEMEKEVTRFLAKVAQEKREGVPLEREAREVRLRCGAHVLEKGLAL